jgi:hypothetical protein
LPGIIARDLGALHEEKKGIEKDIYWRHLTMPTMEETELEGTLGNVSIQERWPLWFVQFLGWHCITFDYLAMVGSGKQ